MAVEQLTPQDAGADARLKINASLTYLQDRYVEEKGYRETQVDDLNRYVVQEREQRERAVAEERGFREQNVNDLNRYVVVEREARIQGDADEARARVADIAYAERPGDAANAFGLATGVAALAGDGTGLIPLPADRRGLGDGGREYLLVGAGIVAKRCPVAIEFGRIYAVRFVAQRRANTSDPSNDTIRFGLAWLDQAKNLVGTTVVADLNDVVTGSGRQARTAYVARTAFAGATHTAPEGACYVVAYVQGYGGDGVTGVQTIALDDITGSAIPPAVSGDAVADIVALKSVNAGPRLDAVEAAVQNPNSLTFATRSDAAAAAITGTVTTVVLRGREAAGDGRGLSYRRAGGPIPPASDSFTDQTGSVWIASPNRSTPINPIDNRATGRSDTQAIGDLVAAFTSSALIAVPYGTYGFDAGAISRNDGQDHVYLWNGAPGGYLPSFPGLHLTPIVGRLQIQRGRPTANNYADLFLVRDVRGATGGTSDFVSSQLRLLTQVGDADQGEWPLIVTLESYGKGEGHHVAVTPQAIRRSAAPDGSTSRLWAQVNELRDYASNPTGATVSIEVGLHVTGGDANRQRRGIDVSLGEANAAGSVLGCEIDRAISVDNTNGTHNVRARKGVVVGCLWGETAFEATSRENLGTAIGSFRRYFVGSTSVQANRPELVIEERRYRDGAGTGATASEILRVVDGGEQNRISLFDDHTEFTQPVSLRFPPYTRATLPDPGLFIGRAVYLSDGPLGRRFAISGGTSWVYADGLQVSTYNG